ncbi:MAG: Xaa-Pro peptidase family protein [Gemmatimonadales bacterium]|jgi:Xaa-Pro aminopeptidase
MSANAFAQRLARVREAVNALDLNGLLVSGLANVRYLSGFSGSNALLLVASDRTVFLTDRRYEQQAADELATDADLELVVSQGSLISALAEGTQLTGATLGFEASHLMYGQWRQLEDAAPGVKWKAVANVVEELRAVKDADEIAALEKAAEIAALALQETLPLVEPGVREIEIATEIEYRMLGLGAQYPAFETIVASGPRTAFPHAATGRRPLQERDLLLCDFGARWRGYHSDLTRTYVIGTPSRQQSDRYELVLAAQRAAVGALQDGAFCSEVDAAARQVFERHGVEASFAHSAGHGVGLEVHEGPRLSRKSEERLRSGMVVTVEPGLYFQAWGGIRIEDDFVVGGDRPRPLVDLEKDRLEALSL